MNEIMLYGDLAEKYGDSLRWAVKTPAEAFRAMSIQLPGFDAAVRLGEYEIFRENEHGVWCLDEDSFALGMHNSKLHVVPVVDGGAAGAKQSKGKGTIKTVIGVSLLAASLLIPGMQGFGIAAAKAAWATTILGSGITYGAMGLVGVSLALGGAAMLISPQPSLSSSSSVDANESSLFSGNASPYGQGRAVPLCYGIFRVPGIPIATQLVTDQIGIGYGQTYLNPYPGYGTDTDDIAQITNGLFGNKIYPDLTGTVS